MGRRIAVVLALLALTIAWCMRPVDPNAWRSFARETKDDELSALYFDDESRSYKRWHHYLQALQAGDDEAFQFEPRVCASIVATKSVHPSEEFYGALGWNLERRPTEVLQLMMRCYPSHPTLVCIPFDHDTEWKHLKSSLDGRTVAVTGLLDGGLAEIATRCLEELRE